MTDKLTERQFWLEYWGNKKNLIQMVSENEYFAPIFRDVIKKNKIETSIEIGGFPGYFSIFLKKYLQVDPTLIDYVIHKRKITELLEFNALKEGSLKLIESDLFSHEPNQLYDLVFSIGFIEHFSNTTQLLEKHINFLNPNGVLIIIVPNFLGINGWLNKKYDNHVYSKHYLKCMDKHYLKLAAQKFELQEIETNYYGKFSIWLENFSSKNFFFKIIFKAFWVLGKITTKIIPLESKILSPYTILVAKKKK